MFPKLICWVKGHRRGKYDSTIVCLMANERGIRCPRCGKTWTRKVNGKA